jgi:hypothetical protein
MSNALKARLDAEIAEHEKTHQRLRTVEKENATLRGLIGDQQREYADAVAMLQGIAVNIQKAFPRATRPTDEITK